MSLKHLPAIHDPVLSTRDYMVSGEEFRICRHPDFDGLLYTNPLPDRLDSYYESEEYLSHQDRPETFLGRLYRSARRWNIRWKLSLLKDYLPASASLLEIGCGQGDFLEAAGKVWNVTGVEPNSGARARASEKGLEVYTRLGEVPAEARDGVVLWHVLEHIPDLEGTIIQIRSHLRRGGHLLLALPNHQSRDAKFYGEFWAGYDVPRHVWHFSKEAVKQVFGAHGFDVIRMKPMWLDAFYVSWLSEKYKGNRWAPVAGAFRGLISNMTAMRTGQPSSVIYVLRNTHPGEAKSQIEAL